jgi:hypothetical protein
MYMMEVLIEICQWHNVHDGSINRNLSMTAYTMEVSIVLLDIEYIYLYFKLVSNTSIMYAMSLSNFY